MRVVFILFKISWIINILIRFFTETRVKKMRLKMLFYRVFSLPGLRKKKAYKKKKCPALF